MTSEQESRSKPVRLVLRGSAEALDLASAELFEAGAGGLLEEGGALVAYPQSDEESGRFQALLVELSRRLGQKSADENSLRFSVEPVASDWQQAWQSKLGPERITPTFTLRPTHCPLEEGAEPEETIWFEPEASFGSGGHATTRLAATFIEAHVRKHPGASFFDVGTGTGVLSLVGARCGSGRTLAVDIDEVSVKAARRNLELNEGAAHMGKGRVDVRLGSADATSESFDLVVANMNTPILLALCEDLSARVAESGVLALTGLLEEDIEDVSHRFGASGLRIVERQLSGEWALLILRR